MEDKEFIELVSDILAITEEQEADDKAEIEMWGHDEGLRLVRVDVTHGEPLVNVDSDGNRILVDSDGYPLADAEDEGGKIVPEPYASALAAEAERQMPVLRAGFSAEWSRAAEQGLEQLTERLVEHANRRGPVSQKKGLLPSAREIACAIAEGLGLDPDRVKRITLDIDANDTIAVVRVEVLPLDVDTKQWRAWAEALPVALDVTEVESWSDCGTHRVDAEGNPLGSIPVVGREETTGPDGCTIGLLRWVEDVIRTKLRTFLLAVIGVGICSTLAALGFGHEGWAVACSITTAMASTAFVLCSSAGVWQGDEWAALDGVIDADRPLSQDEVDEVMKAFRRADGDGS